MISFPFDSDGEDRAVGSVAFRNIFKKYFTNGVFANPSTTFQVFEGTGMTVNVYEGYANIEGAIAFEEDIRTLNIEASDTLDRIDRVVLRLNDNKDARKIDLYIVKGTPHQTPVAPAIVRNETIYEISLATIYVNANITVIQQSRITDTRLDSTVCGIVAQAVNGIDTTTLYAQIQNDLSDFKENEQAEFVYWFDNVKEKLSEDVAGKLFNEINTIKETTYTKDMVDTLLKSNLTTFIEVSEIPTSSFIEDSELTYKDYPIVTTISDARVKQSHIAVLSNNPNNFSQGYITDTSDGSIDLYCQSIPKEPVLLFGIYLTDTNEVKL